MTTRMASVFDSKPLAERAHVSLAEYGLGHDKMELTQGAAPGLASNDAETATCSEAVRCGGTILLARVDGAQVEMAAAFLEKNGTVGLDRCEQD